MLDTTEDLLALFTKYVGKSIPVILHKTGNDWPAKQVREIIEVGSDEVITVMVRGTTSIREETTELYDVIKRSEWVFEVHNGVPQATLLDPSKPYITFMFVEA